ncbi:MAG: DUF975 family protein [Oscillospiraceae bacterium]|nr:DUF975 family protein [Oscillospiraceae bacterium]
MHIINREQIKSNAKAKVLDSTLNLLPITAVFLALTDLLSNLLHFFVESPINTIAEEFFTVIEDIRTAALEAEMQVAPNLAPAYAAAGRVARELLSHPTKQALLFGFLVLYLYQLVMSFGFRGVCLRVNRGERLNWANLFDTLWMAGRIVLLNLLAALLIYIGAFFFLLPGLMAYYGLRLTPFVMLDHPEWSALRCMAESWRLSSGMKMGLFWLDLSFVGWDFVGFLATSMGLDLGGLLHPLAAVLLSAVLYGIIAVFYLPYKAVTLAEYYEILRSTKPLPTETPRHEL